MKVRPLDINGDMMPIQQSSQLLDGAQAVAQVAKERLAFYYGEWWEDETLGIRIPDFLMSSVRESDISLFAKYITSYLGETEGVIGISGASVELKGKQMIYRATILTEFGSAGVEVDLNALL